MPLYMNRNKIVKKSGPKFVFVQLEIVRISGTF